MLIDIDPKTQREEWLEGRRKGLGSSDAPAIVLPYSSRPKYMSPWAVWDSKLNGREEEDESLFMDFGNRFEKVVGEYVRDHVNENTPDQQYELGPGGWYQNDDQPWMMASPDFFLCPIDANAEGVECKVIQNSVNAADWLEGSAPPHVTVQAHWCMAVTGAKRWHIGVLLWFTQEFRVYTVEFDQGFHDRMVAKAGTWWKAHVIAGNAPPVDNTDACAQVVQREYADHDAIIRTANDVESTLLLEYGQARHALKAAESEKKRLENLLKIIVSSNRGVASTSGGRFLWSSQKGRTSLDQKRLKADEPELFDAYTKRGASFRTIRFTAPKEG